jgi:hypothetical protein
VVIWFWYIVSRKIWQPWKVGATASIAKAHPQVSLRAPIYFGRIFVLPFDFFASKTAR